MTPEATRTARPARYVMIAPSYSPNTGGVERHVAGVHAALGRLGHVGRVIVLNASPAPRDLPSGVEWIDFPRGRSRRRILAQPGSIVRLFTSLRSERGSVLHFHDASTIHPFLPLLRASGLLAKTFMTFHGWEGIYPPEPKVVQQRLECEQAVRASMLVGEFIRRWYGAKGDCVTYGGTDVAKFGAFPSVDPAAPLRAAFVGRLEPDTGLAVVLDAFRRLRGLPGAPVTLSVFGAGSLEGLVRKEPGDAVTLEAPPADIAQVYRSFPIIFASGYLTILEALAAGRIVFACYDNPLRKDYLTLHPAAASCVVCGDSAEVLGGLIDCREQMASVLARSAPGWQWARTQSWDRLAVEYRSLWSARG